MKTIKISNFIAKNLNLIVKNIYSYDTKKFDMLIKFLKEIKKNKKKVMIMGNGASASIANHFATDLTKIAGIRTINFNESNLITCLANDYGYENWLKKAIEFYGDRKDLIILVSSSGNSKNIVNAARYGNKKKIKIITFSGFNKDNPLRKLGNVNFWVNSKKYNQVELVHLTWLLLVVDFLKKK
tara:strand:- start:85 stop:636 length:552 start_codon:yes stop_codon:yes gene_type:complete